MLNRIRVWLPVLTALTANSPVLAGRRHRVRQLPVPRVAALAVGRTDRGLRRRRRLPPADRRRSGDRHRPGLGHGLFRRPPLGEVADRRGPDRRRRPPGRGRRHPRRAGPRAGRDRRPRGAAGTPAPAVPAQVLRLAAWRAGRSGLDRRPRPPLHRPPGARPPRSWTRSSTTSGRHWPTPATSSGSTDGLAAILRRGTGADLQRRVHQETGGDLGAVVRAAVADDGSAAGGAAQATASRPG